MRLLIRISVILAISCLGAATQGKDRPEPNFKKQDSMLVMPEALKRVPVPLQVAAWASFHELMDRGLVVDPTLAMLSGVRNPFCVKDITVVITRDSSRIEFKVDSLCAGAMLALPQYPVEVDTSETIPRFKQDIQVRISSGQIQPVKFAWPQTMPLDSASIRALYRISFQDKGDLGWHELFGSFDADELMICDSTRPVIIR